MELTTSATPIKTRSGKVETYERLGFHIERGLLEPIEIEQIARAFMQLHEAGGVSGRYELAPEGRKSGGFLHAEGQGDPLASWPRVMHPHKFMSIAHRYLLDPRIIDVLEELTGEQVLAAQSMFYFKPPGARGQAWHQDNFYLRVSPGTCIAAWIAVDPSDRENGGLRIVPNTHRLKVACPEVSDPAASFTKELVPLPAGASAVELCLAPGDVLFFNGSVIHGSTPNQSKHRFRRSLINHYVGQSCHELSGFYLPLLDRLGHESKRTVATGGGPCGTELLSQPH
jgi:hypothetical protein